MLKLIVMSKTMVVIGVIVNITMLIFSIMMVTQKFEDNESKNIQNKKVLFVS